jgi:hypothetical protein
LGLIAWWNVYITDQQYADGPWPLSAYAFYSLPVLGVFIGLAAFRLSARGMRYIPAALALLCFTSGFLLALVFALSPHDGAAGTIL